MPEAAAVARLERPDHLEARHRRFLTIESLLATFFSGAVPAAAIWMFRNPVPLPLLGSHSLASTLIMGTLAPGFGVPITLTLVVRYRVRRGGAPALGWPLRAPGPARWLPGPLVLRGVVAAAVGMLIVPPAGLLLMVAAGVRTVSATGVVLYNFFHGMALAALVLPPVIVRALADGARRPVGVANVARVRID